MNFRDIRLAAAASLMGALSMSVHAAQTAPDPALKAAIADTARGPANTVRDVYRHPYETLSFWGLKPGLTVVEIAPGGGYWTEILAPYTHATGGHLAVTQPDLSATNLSERARKSATEFEARFADENKFGKVRWAAWSEAGGALGAPASVDLLITARNIHNWMWTPGQLDKLLGDFYTVLKHGGTLAVEEHRADPRAQVPNARDGYVNTSYLIAAARKAGLKLEASSEINANPKDTKDYPFGVWTLPPSNSTTAPSAAESWPNRPSVALEPAHYLAIGESDRMTLRFRKP